MADLVNPYANPYLPSFVNQRPRINDTKPVLPQLNLGNVNYTQIQSVNGFAGAREYAANQLAPGASGIIAESDPNTARVYIVAKDSQGQTIVEGYRLIHEDEPKPVTMDDLNAKMSEILDRMNKLEEENKHGSKSVSEPSWKNRPANTNAATGWPNGRSDVQPSSVSTADDAKRSKDSTGS